MKSCIIWCKKKNSDFFLKKDFTVALKAYKQAFNFAPVIQCQYCTPRQLVR